MSNGRFYLKPIHLPREMFTRGNQNTGPAESINFMS